ncbi:MAG: enoyl-CoA hydratase-related protein [Acidimicrobiia bacterium]
MSAVTYRVEGTTAHITVNDTSWGLDTHLGILDGLARASVDRTVIAVLVGSAGPDFGAGPTAPTDPAELKTLLDAIARVPVAIRTGGKTVVASVKGRCRGAANQFQMMCDLTVAAESAVFAVDIAHGAEPMALIGGQFLPRIVGEKKAREMVFLGRDHGPSDHKAFVNTVVAESELEAASLALCEEIARLSPTSLRMVKASISFNTDLLFSSIWQAVDYAVLAAIEKAPIPEGEAPAPALAPLPERFQSLEYTVGEGFAIARLVDGSAPAALDELLAVLRHADSDPDIKSLVLRVGPGCGWQAGTKGWMAALVTLRNIAMPTIVVLEGESTATATELAVVADLVVAADGATIGMAAGRPPAWGSQLLAGAVRERQARRMGLLGTTLSADEAKAAGLVNWVVDDTGLDGFVADLTAEIAGLDQLGIQVAKSVLNYGGNMAYPTILSVAEQARS